MAFSYYAPPRLLGAVAPAFGPIAGGTHVRIAALGLRTELPLARQLCEESPVPLAFESMLATHVLYVTPPAPVGHDSCVPRIWVGEDSYTSSDADPVLFRYYTPPPLLTLDAPRFGPAAGGTRVRVLGFESLLASFNISIGALTPVVRFGASLRVRNESAGKEGAGNESAGNEGAGDKGAGNESVLADEIAYAASTPPPTLVANEAAGTLLDGGVLEYLTPPLVSAMLSEGAGGGDPLPPNRLVTEGGTIKLTFTLDGLTYEDLPDVHFTYTAASPIIHSIFPASDTSAGGRVLTVRGSALGGPQPPLCRWGGETVLPSTRIDAGSTLLCASPRWPPAGDDALSEASFSSTSDGATLPPTAVSLELSLNGQQWFGGDAAKGVSGAAGGGGGSLLISGKPPRLLEVSPTAGPVLGGTRVALRGLHLGGGTSYLCRFGTLPPVEATYDSFSAAIRCEAPLREAGEHGLSVSVNGVHFEEGELEFSVSAQDTDDFYVDFGSGDPGSASGFGSGSGDRGSASGFGYGSGDRGSASGFGSGSGDPGSASDDPGTASRFGSGSGDPGSGSGDPGSGSGVPGSGSGFGSGSGDPGSASGFGDAVSIEAGYGSGATLRTPLSFKWYAEPSLIALDPSAGPGLGTDCLPPMACGSSGRAPSVPGTLVRISGAGLSAATAEGVRCSFNGTSVDATASNHGTAVACRSPTSASFGAVPVRLILNTQVKSPKPPLSCPHHCIAPAIVLPPPVYSPTISSHGPLRHILLPYLPYPPPDSSIPTRPGREQRVAPLSLPPMSHGLLGGSLPGPRARQHPHPHLRRRTRRRGWVPLPLWRRLWWRRREQRQPELHCRRNV